ncbi:MAG: SLATT domain-containing protein [Candidatus Euphemobacter frigidus]|nr:SLATT domain-containing protein [Candidatus Euphemobacter frigidus]
MKIQTTTEEKVASKSLEAIIKEAKRIEENGLYTSKGHFTSANYWSKFHLWVGIPTLVLATIAGTAALGQFDTKNIIAGVLSIIIVLFTAIATFLNPKEKASNHLTAGNHYDSLLTRARIFWTIECHGDKTEEILTEKLMYLSEEKDRLNRESPQVLKWAFKKARRDIEEGEASYKVDDEEAK